MPPRSTTSALAGPIVIFVARYLGPFPGGPHSGRAGLGGGSVGVEIGQNDGQVLGVGEEADNVGVIRPHEVEPADWKALDSSDSKPGNVAQLTDTWRSGIGHPLYGSQRRNSSIEEANAEIGSAFSAVVPGAFDEIGLSQRSQQGDGHRSTANAR